MSKEGGQTGTTIMTHKVFRKRKGTTDVGKDYENLVMANFALNLVEDDTIQNFNLWSNDANFGSFDDVILELQSTDCKKCKKFAFQLKHFTKDKQFVLKALNEDKGNFSIKKYFESFQKHKEFLSDYDLILLTNLKFSLERDVELQLVDKEAFRIKIVEVEVNPLVNTKKEKEKCLQFQIVPEDHSETLSNILKDYKIFFERFYIYTDQMNVDMLNIEIPNRLERKFFCKIEVSNKYLKFFTDWNLLETSKDTLHKTMMKRLIALYLVSANIRPISFGKISENRKLLQTAISMFHVSLFEKTSLQEGQSVWVACRDNTDIKEANTVNKNYQITRKKIDNIAHLGEEECSQLLWLMGKCPLIVEETPTVYEAFKLCSDRTFVLLANGVDKKNLGNYPVFYKLSDLENKNEIYENILSNFKCLLPQREINLSELVNNTELIDTITTNELLLMTDADYEFKQEQEDLPMPYISRQLSRIVIKVEYLEKIERESLILICNVSNQQKSRYFEKYKALDVSEYLKKSETSIQFNQKGIIFVSCEMCSRKTFNLICEKNKTRKTLHFFKSLESHLEWIQSVGDIATLYQHFVQDRDTVQEEELIDTNYENKVHLIIGDPGLGKSWLLKSLKNKFTSKVVAVIFTPADVGKICTFLQQNGNKMDDVCEYILELKYSHYKMLDRCVVTSFTRKLEVIYLWDALDEIVSNKNRNTIIEVVQHFARKGIVQWISSRQHLKSELESKFCVLSRTLYEFNQNQQEEYIHKRLKTVCSNQENYKLTENIINNVTIFKHKDILSIPLQIYMLTEICRQDKNRSDLIRGMFSLSDLYDYFVDEKFNFCYKKEPHFEESYLDKLEQDKIWIIRRLEKAAMKTVLDEDILKELNIDTDETVEDVQRLGDRFGFVTEVREHDSEFSIKFAHISYAEFFVASYFARRKMTKIKDFIFDEEYTNLRYFFDLILAKNCPAHLAVLCSNISEVEEHKNEMNSKDAGGRNPLQLACSWGPLWKVLFEKADDTFYAKSGSQSNSENVLVCIQLIVMLMTTCDINEVDGLFSMNSIQYAERSYRLWALATMEEKHCIEYFNTKDDNIKCTTLCYSVKCNLPHFIILFKNYVNCVKSQDESSLLHLACEEGHESVVEILIEAGADINASDREGLIPLRTACSNGYENIVEILIKAGADINASDKDRVTPLISACLNGHEKIVEMLIMVGADIDASDGGGYTALRTACMNGNEHVVKMLINGGVDLKASDNGGCTPLMSACLNNHDKIVETLIKGGIDVNASDKGGSTPLTEACWNGHERIVEMLIKAGVNINASDVRGVTPLRTACLYGREKVVEMLINAEVDVNTSDKCGVTPLMSACLHGHEKIVEMLIQAKADVNASDKKGYTPLRDACINGNQQIVEMLIQAGVNINASDTDGFSPLMSACLNNHENIVETLINAGVDINTCDTEGFTTFMSACAKGHAKIVEMLIKQGVDINASDKDGFSSLIYACDNGNEKIVKILLESAANVNAADIKCETSLLKSCRNGHEKVVKMLIQAGADVNASNENGYTALGWAVENGHEEVADILKSFVKSV